jgi:hypothetical protein
MKTMKNKQKSSKSKTFAQGGSGKMFGMQHAGPQKSGVSAHSTKGSGGKWGKGGSGKMFGMQHASKMRSGRSGK